MDLSDPLTIQSGIDISKWNTLENWLISLSEIFVMKGMEHTHTLTLVHKIRNQKKTGKADITSADYCGLNGILMSHDKLSIQGHF